MTIRSRKKRRAPQRAASARRRTRRTLPKPVGVTVVCIVGLMVISGVLLVALRLIRQGSLPGVEVAGRDVGALDERELRAAVADLEQERGRDLIFFRRRASGQTAGQNVSVRGGDLGYSIDEDATFRRVLDRGRQANPFAALVDQLTAFFGTISVDPVDSFLAQDGTSLMAETARTLSSPPYYGGVRFKGGQPQPRYPEPGIVVLESELAEVARDAIRTPGDDEVTVEPVAVDPSTTRSDVDALVDEARSAIDGRVRLRSPRGSVTFTPREIASLLKTDVTGAPSRAQLSLRIPPGELTEVAGDRLSSLEAPPQDAEFELSGSSVRVVPAQPGFRVSAANVATRLLEVALRPGPEAARLRGKKQPAGFTTAEARALDIKERVASFTTYHACCEPRVDNIHRIADLVDGTVVEPGDSFSLNEHVGPRTTANGFVAAPAIRDGEFVEEVGGGISQFATTMFNAIFFGGYDFLEYQPHSYYISRYPPGREATISTPGPDLAFLNDSDAGVYIDTSYSETSITVSFFGSQDFDVDAREGPRKNVTPPRTTCRENSSLAAGEENVVQEGLTGFDIVVSRIFGDGRPNETFSTHYDMQERIVERRRCAEKKKKDGKD